ncbi:MAG: hydrogenase maturation nickel metallochaperone HypA [Chloroflexi bacterium]|nr:hydrogenase maturation nickel metallochaperone HypA [Chloroflexota bacterium]
MHELSITQALYDLTLDEANGLGANRVTALTVQVGALTAIDPSAVVFYFETMSKGSCAEGALIHFDKVMPTARCQNCHHEMPIPTSATNGSAGFNYAWLQDYNQMVCENCGHQRFELVGGHEFALLSLEIE